MTGRAALAKSDPIISTDRAALTGAVPFKLWKLLHAFRGKVSEYGTKGFEILRAVSTEHSHVVPVVSAPRKRLPTVVPVMSAPRKKLRHEDGSGGP